MDLFRKKPITRMQDPYSLAKCLSAFDLLFLGIGAIIGAGIFVLTGIVAATNAGPAIIFSYIVAGFACVFAALAYAELAALVGGCGSAYSYAYAGFGEFMAWIVGWDLLLEYTVSVSAVSVGWSGYFKNLLIALHIYIPNNLLSNPFNGGLVNTLAVLIIFTLSILLILGVKASTRINNVMVLIKLSVIALFILIASSHVHTENWTPFMPFGWSGIMHGASLIFFAYIGFDAVSTAAEEAINPQRDLPIGIIGSLIICTIIYIVVAALLTGIVPYTALNVSAPISQAMIIIGYKTVAGLIGVGAVAGLTTVMLVLFYGLTRIFLAMARDGLLPQIFAKTNANTKTPIRIILLCAVIMSLLAGFLPLHDLAELVNVGTLFAFISVCFGVIVLRYRQPDLVRPFKTPGMPIIPLLGVVSCSYLIANLPWFTLMRFIIWMLIGFIVYFTYSQSHSVLNQPKNGN
jgi:APA family basic amino acid/polyamine antiporter